MTINILLPITIHYVKYRDGINSLNEVIDSRKAPQKRVYVTIEYTNTRTEQLNEVLFLENIIKIVEENGPMKCYDTRVKRSRNPMQACLQEDF